MNGINDLFDTASSRVRTRLAEYRDDIPSVSAQLLFPSPRASDDISERKVDEILDQRGVTGPVKIAIGNAKNVFFSTLAFRDRLPEVSQL